MVACSKTGIQDYSYLWPLFFISLNIVSKLFFHIVIRYFSLALCLFRMENISVVDMYIYNEQRTTMIKWKWKKKNFWSKYLIPCYPADDVAES